MKAGCRATAAVAQLSLASHYPISMYNDVAGGTRRWRAQVRSPLYRSMRLGDLLVASLVACAPSSAWTLPQPMRLFCIPYALGGSAWSLALIVCSALSWNPTQGNLTSLSPWFVRPPVTGFFGRKKSFIPLCSVLRPQHLNSFCRMLMTIANSLSFATGCAWRCTCPRNP